MKIVLKCGDKNYFVPESVIPESGFVTVMYDESRVARLFVDKTQLRISQLEEFAKTGKPVQVVLTY